MKGQVLWKGGEKGVDEGVQGEDERSGNIHHREQNIRQKIIIVIALSYKLKSI